MRKNKILSLILILVILAAAVTGAIMVFAGTNNEPPADDILIDDPDLYDPDVMPPDYNANEPQQAYYIKVTGTVISVEEFYGTDDWRKIEIAYPTVSHGTTDMSPEYEGAIAHIIVTDRTVFPFENIESVTEGDTVTAFVLANAPMTMIYPPQYTAAVLVAGSDLNVQVDRFTTWENEDFPFLSNIGNFAFAIDENTEIITADGDEFNFAYGDLEGRRLVVIYGMSTRSIPEYATAAKVIVLFEDLSFGPEPLPEPGSEYDEDFDYITLPDATPDETD